MPDFEYVKPRKRQQRYRPRENIFIAVFNGIFPRKGDSVADVMRKTILIFSVAVIIYAGITLVNDYVERDINMRRIQSEINRQKEDAAVFGDKKITVILNDKKNNNSDNNSSSQVEILSEYQSYYEKNNEFVGWVKIDPIVNFPVAQADNNDYYLNHNFEKIPTANGTIFADYEGEFTETKRPNNTILYGHNLRTHYFFEPLLNYYRKGLDFVKEHSIVEFDTLYERGRYKVFAGFLTNTREYQGEPFEYWKSVYFKNKSEFDNYVAECLDRSYFYTGIDLQYGDELLTLSTCDFTMDETRFVLVARRVRESESPLVDTAKFVDNNGVDSNGMLKRKMFDGYYKLRGVKGWAGRTWDTSWIKDFKKDENVKT